MRRILDAVAGLGVLTIDADVIALTALGSRSVRAWLGLGTPESGVLCLNVTLRESADPLIWRRLRVPADMRLDRFHLVLGAAMGWQDSHLHVFERGAERYGFADPELDIRADRDVTIGALLVEPGDRLDYEYDFGDSWQHEIVLQALEGANGKAPCCIDGAGRCPPEDVGGTPGYEDLRRALAAPGDDRHAELLEWLGLEDAHDFDATAFDVEHANDAIGRVLVAWSA
ncbi:MAG: plasmid pRiA4b ORF-3 family protein [Solirubrobacteraceae bacterium]